VKYGFAFYFILFYSFLVGGGERKGRREKGKNKRKKERICTIKIITHSCPRIHFFRASFSDSTDDNPFSKELPDYRWVNNANRVFAMQTYVLVVLWPRNSAHLLYNN
jgi:hypothetical protein